MNPISMKEDFLYTREYAAYYSAFGGRMHEQIPAADQGLLWKTLKKATLVDSGVSQSSGIVFKTYRLKGHVYDCLWNLYSTKDGDPPQDIVEIVKMEKPRTPQTNLRPEKKTLDGLLLLVGKMSAKKEKAIREYAAELITNK